MELYTIRLAPSLVIEIYDIYEYAFFVCERGTQIEQDLGHS